MKNNSISEENGWVVASMNGTFIIEYSYARTRKEAIEKWMSLWDKSRCSWRKFKKEGYKCVKAKRTISILPTNK